MNAPSYGTVVLRHHLFVKTFEAVLDAGGELDAMRDPVRMVETLGAASTEFKAAFDTAGDLDEIREMLEDEVGREFFNTQLQVGALKLKMIVGNLVSNVARWIEEDPDLSRNLADHSLPSTPEELKARSDEVMGRWLESETPEVEFAAAVGRARSRIDLLDLRRTKTVDFWSVLIGMLEG
jgi:hypothetical protein